MHILTTIPRFPEQWSVSTGEHGTARTLSAASDFLQQAPQADLLLIDGAPELALKIAAGFLIQPWKRKPIIGIDFVLRRPETARFGVAAAVAKRFLFSRIDHFIHYFRDLRDYQRYYGIGPERSSFVPYKPNIRYRHDVPPNPDGEYVLCFGRSMRDYDTFFAAMERLAYPGAVPEPNFDNLRKHGSRFTRPLGQLPANVRLLKDDGSSIALVEVIGNARIVVLPILKSSLLAGIGTYLNGMYMGKCVIISDGPGASDVLTSGEALFVPPEDPEALAAMIARVWEDDELRIKTAKAGYVYASGLGGEPELWQRILETSIGWLRASGRMDALARRQPGAKQPMRVGKE